MNIDPVNSTYDALTSLNTWTSWLHRIIVVKNADGQYFLQKVKFWSLSKKDVDKAATGKGKASLKTIAMFLNSLEGQTLLIKVKKYAQDQNLPPKAKDKNAAQLHMGIEELNKKIYKVSTKLVSSHVMQKTNKSNLGIEKVKEPTTYFSNPEKIANNLAKWLQKQKPSQNKTSELTRKLLQEFFIKLNAGTPLDDILNEPKFKEHDVDLVHYALIQAVTECSSLNIDTVNTLKNLSVQFSLNSDNNIANIAISVLKSLQNNDLIINILNLGSNDDEGDIEHKINLLILLLYLPETNNIKELLQLVVRNWPLDAQSEEDDQGRKVDDKGDDYHFQIERSCEHSSSTPPDEVEDFELRGHTNTDAPPPSAEEILDLTEFDFKKHREELESQYRAIREKREKNK